MSRTFCDNAKIDSIEEIDRVFKINMQKVREFETFAAEADDEIHKKNRIELNEAVARVAEIMRKRKNEGQ